MHCLEFLSCSTQPSPCRFSTQNARPLSWGRVETQRYFLRAIHLDLLTWLNHLYDGHGRRSVFKRLVRRDQWSRYNFTLEALGMFHAEWCWPSVIFVFAVTYIQPCFTYCWFTLGCRVPDYSSVESLSAARFTTLSKDSLISSPLPFVSISTQCFNSCRIADLLMCLKRLTKASLNISYLIRLQLHWLFASLFLACASYVCYY